MTKLPASVNATVGSQTKLTLELEDAENYTVQWFKGADKVEKSDRHKSVKSGNTFKLDFKVGTALYFIRCISRLWNRRMKESMWRR